MKILKHILIVAVLVFNSGLLISQDTDPHLEYLMDFHQKEAEYMAQLHLDSPDLSNEELRTLKREYYRENFNPPKSPSEQRTSALKTSDMQGRGHVNASESFNQVPDSIEYLALRALFESTNGPNWIRYTNWDYPNWKDPSTVSSADFEDWIEVKVENGDVVDIYLSRYNLNGTIPSEIGSLSALRFLDLSFNQISGSIPPELTNIVGLEGLALDRNQLSGPLPSNLENLSSLRSLWLTSNQFSGSIPPELGDLSNLMYLSLGENQLSGSIPPELSDLTGLRSLFLYDNELSGSIPANLTGLSSLEDLSLFGNQLSGSIPANLDSLSALDYLILYDNQLSGSIPPELGNLANLRYLDVGRNQLSGSIPASLGSLSVLETLYVFENQLSGPIPPELGSLVALRYLNLSENQLFGPIPPELGNLSNLMYLYLAANQLSGPIPSELGSLSELRSLQLSLNQLSGSLPSSLGGLSGLNGLILGISFNELMFDDLEHFFDGQGWKYNFQYFWYTPQNTVLGDSVLGDTLNVTVSLNQPIAIPFSTGGEHNLYQWQKLTGGTWQDIPGADSAEYYKPNASLADVGTYRCKVTNEWVTGLTLYSHEIIVTLTEDLPEPPVADSVHICPGQIATLTATASGTIYWFGTASEGDTLEIGMTFTTPALDSTTVYYVSQVVNGVHSERIPVAALVGPVFTVSENQTVCMGTDNDVTLLIEGEDLTVDWGDFGSDRGIVVSPDTTTTYAYTIEDAYGCAISGSIIVTVLDSLIAGIIPPAPLCPGEPAVFEAVEVAGATYLWEPGGLTSRIISVDSPEMQQYTLTVTNSNGCTATASEFIPFAALATVSDDQTICVIDSVLLSADGGDHYLWSTGDTTSQITYSPAYAGQHTLTVSVTTDNCTTSQNINVTVEPHCPGTPVSFYARAISTSAISLQWQEPVGNQQQYVVQKRNAAGAYVTLETVPVGTTSWIDEELEADSIYYYSIYSEVASVQSESRTSSARTFPERENYVHETILLIENIKDVTLVPGLEDHKRSSSWTYLNGLGSEMQTIIAAASPSGRDMVQPVVYDDNGMVSEQYLPYTVENSPKGNFRGEAKQEVLDFYDEVDPPAAVATTAFPFATTVYGNSPQNKVVAQGAHGEEWQVGTGRSVSLTTATNGTEEVIHWEYNAGTGSLTANEYYPLAQLTKAITVNEDGEKAVSYKDMLGRELKQEVFLSDDEINETYYVYNNKGQLLFKITPLVVEQATTSGNLPFSISKTLIESLCYSYFYDEKGRLVETKWSDKESVFYVYDQWNRLTLSQDGNQRQRNEWSFTKYDRYNRAVLSGLYKTQTLASRSEMKTAVDSHYAQSGSTRFESYGGSVHGYTNTSYPIVSDENDYLSVSYHDSYDFIDEVPGFGSDYGFDATALGCETIAQGEYCFPSKESRNVEGVPTGSKTKVLGRDQWLASVVYYDERGRGVQTVTQNYIGSIDRQSSLYNFAGWVLSTYLSHNGADGKSRGIRRRYIYDHTGRLMQGYHELFDTGIGQGEVFLAENKYNELGQLIEKNLHIEEGAPIQSIDYRYNIRGWLKSINGANSVAGEGINANDARQDLFGMELIYDGILNGIQNSD